jgi:DNA polymerase-1
MVFREELTDEGLWPQYRERMDLHVPVYAAENHGMTFSEDKCQELTQDFQAKLLKERTAMFNLAPKDFTNPASPKQLVKLLYEDWKLPVLAYTKNKKKKTPSTGDKEALKPLMLTLHHESREYKFIQHLQNVRKLANSINFLGAYHRGGFTVCRGWLRLHTTINITGPRTTRFSTSGPSQQNVSKQDDYNLRSIFGPAPGREWWSIDQSNVEMRLFAYCSGDKKLIKAFEDGYAVHLIFAEILYPREFAECVRDGVSFKDRYKSTFYQWIKNGNFALIYGAGEDKANATYRLPGAYDKIRKYLPLVDQFIRKMYDLGMSQGYVELLGGYRLQVPRSDPHKAANYFIQGSAAWAIQVAMNRIWEYLYPIRQQYKMFLQVHDELDFDFPLALPGVNESIIRHIGCIMEQSGDDISIPLPVEISRHPETWAKGIPLELAA